MTEPHYTDATVTLHHGDCLDVLRSLPDASVDAVCTDPPYALGFMGREWDTFGMDVGRGAQARRQRATEVTPEGQGHSTSAGPYLASGVDSLRAAGLPFQRWCEAWATECLRVLKPGGHLLAFGGTRTWHRLACAVEDAGFEVRDSIAWLYGSGFPKSLDVSKAIDKRAEENAETKRRIALVAEVIRTHREAKGMERAAVSLAVVGTPSGACWNWEHQQLPSVEMWPAIKRVLDIPDEFDGLIEGDRAQFIAAERAVIGQRTTGIGTGRGAVAYIADSENRDITAPATDAARTWQGWGTALKPAFEPIVVARKPLVGTVAANVLAHGTGALNIAGCRIESGSDYHDLKVTQGGKDGGGFDVGSSDGTRHTTFTPAAGRWPANVVLDESQAAALDEQSGETVSKRANRGSDGGIFRLHGFSSPDELAVAAARGEKCPDGRDAQETYRRYLESAENDNTRGVDDQGGASRFFYVAKADATERVRVNGTAHPTVKPLALMRWLVRLVTPPGGTVLEPFAGSGTTVEACILEGFRCVAIEREADYLPLIVQRINRRRDPVEAVRASGEDGGLFDLLDGGAA